MTIDKKQFGIMPERGTIDAALILRRQQGEYQSKGKSCMCFVDLDKGFDRVPRKVLEWAMMKKGIPEVLVRSMMSLYDATKTRMRVDSEESKDKVGCTKDQCYQLFFLQL